MHLPIFHFSRITTSKIQRIERMTHIGSTQREYTIVIICVLDRLLKSTTTVEPRTWPYKETENIVTFCMVSLAMSHRSSCWRRLIEVISFLEYLTTSY